MRGSTPLPELCFLVVMCGEMGEAASRRPGLRAAGDAIGLSVQPAAGSPSGTGSSIGR